MITVTKTDSAVQFEFDGSQHYLYDGTMEVPFNSLILVEDESDMITFRKASTNDILFSAMYTEFSSLGDTKDAVVSALEDMMFAEGGGGGGVDPEDVVEIVESALTDYWTSAQTQSAINQASSGKQDTLVSGTNIKTINNESLLGSGNITISGGSGSNIIELTQAEYDALVDKDPDALYIITDASEVNLSGYALSSAVTQEISAAVSGKADSSAVTQSLTSKQDTLVSGTNIKTVNNQSLLGSGNITISGGSGSYVYYSEDTTVNTATIHIENTDDGTTSEVYVDGASVDISALRTEEDNGSMVETHSDINGNNAGIAMSYEKLIDGEEATHSYLNVNEGLISMEIMSNDGEDTNILAVSNSAVTINNENVVTEDQLADYQPLLSAGTGIDITNNVISATGGGGVTIDQSLDTGSTNPVANSAITTAINGKANRSAAFGSYSFGSNSNGEYLQYRSVSSANLGNEIYYPKINGKSLLTSNRTYAANNLNFSLVETSAMTSAMTSSSTDAQVPTAKAVYDQVGGLKFVSLTQSEYDALVTKDNTTIYFIKNNSN